MNWNFLFSNTENGKKSHDRLENVKVEDFIDKCMYGSIRKMHFPNKSHTMFTIVSSF